MSAKPATPPTTPPAMAPTLVFDEEASDGLLLAPAWFDVEVLDVDTVLVAMEDVVLVA